MKLKFPIYIPTYGRASLQAQKTYNALPDNYKARVVFVIRREEVRDFQKLDLRYIIQRGKGVANARQAACDHIYPNPCIMLDDDLNFSTRVPKPPEDKFYKSVKATEEEVGAAIDWMFGRVGPKCPVVGLGTRRGNQSIKPELEYDNYRIMRSFGVCTASMARKGFKIDDFYYWEDFHIAVSFLEVGLPNVINLHTTTDGVTNTKGGIVRDLDKMRAVQKAFAKRHRLAVPVSKENMHGMEGGVPDFRIPWKKIYKEAIANA